MFRNTCVGELNDIGRQHYIHVLFYVYFGKKTKKVKASALAKYATITFFKKNPEVPMCICGSYILVAVHTFSSAIDSGREIEGVCITVGRGQA